MERSGDKGFNYIRKAKPLIKSGRCIWGETEAGQEIVIRDGAHLLEYCHPLWDI